MIWLYESDPYKFKFDEVTTTIFPLKPSVVCKKKYGKNMKQIIFLFSCLLLVASVQGQDLLSFGFKAGLNFSTIEGDSEIDQAGNELEEYTTTQGFNVGAIINFRLTDYFGLRTELLYNQKGTQYSFDGPSYFVFDPQNERIVSEGNRDLELEISNSYIQIPILAYAKIGRIEFMGGAYASALVNSTGEGRLLFNANSLQGTDFETLEFGLDYGYFGDDIGGFLGDLEVITVEGDRVEIPSTLTAYYEDTQDERLFKTLDFGLIGGVSFYFSQGLFINVRGEFGLTDVTNDEVDRSLSTLNNNEFIFRQDMDRNFTLHTAVGFRF